MVKKWISDVSRTMVTIFDDQPGWDADEFDASYREMGEDEARETEALALSEATIEDSGD